MKLTKIIALSLQIISLSAASIMAWAGQEEAYIPFLAYCVSSILLASVQLLETRDEKRN